MSRMARGESRVENSLTVELVWKECVLVCYLLKSFGFPEMVSHVLSLARLP
jgi:hypothetical protein